MYNGLLYAIGGRDSASSTLASVEAFDGRAWSDVVAMGTRRSYHGAAVLGGLLFSVGGWIGGIDILNSVECFNGTSWTSAPSMATRRSGLAVGVLE